MKPSYTRPTIVILILALLVMCFVALRQCESKKEIIQTNDLTQFRTVIEGLQNDTTDLRTQLREKTRRIAQDSTERAKVISVGSGKIVRQKATAVIIQPKVQPVIDSLPIVKEFMALKDSTIAELTNVNELLNESYKAQVKGLNEQIELHGQVQAKNDEIMRLYEERIAKLMKDNRKERRGKKFWRGTALVLGATTAVLILAK
jgi:hypothetical protein